jgi:CRISPR/Cas system-associated exonuclease Cas4 (RecB family)
MNKNLANEAKVEYISYFQAMELLKARLKAKPEDLAAWVLFEDNRLNAYLNVGEVEPPREFTYAMLSGVDDHSYLKPLMYCRFSLNQIENYIPSDYYITGNDLIARWSKYKSLDPKVYIEMLIKSSRLQDIHPITGLTQASVDDESFPAIEDGLFSLSDIEIIELQDLTVELKKEKKLNSTDHNPKWQLKANEVANKYKEEYGRWPTKAQVISLLMPILNKTFDNIRRRIKRKW